MGQLVRKCAWAPRMLWCDKGQELGVLLVSEHGTSLSGQEGKWGRGWDRKLLQVLKRIEAAGVCNLVGLMKNLRGMD